METIYRTGPQEASFPGAPSRRGGVGGGEGEPYEAREGPGQCVFRGENFALFLPELQYDRCTLEASYLPKRKRQNASNHPTNQHSTDKIQNPYSPGQACNQAQNNPQGSPNLDVEEQHIAFCCGLATPAASSKSEVWFELLMAGIFL